MIEENNHQIKTMSKSKGHSSNLGDKKVSGMEYVRLFVRSNMLTFLQENVCKQ